MICLDMKMCTEVIQDEERRERTDRDLNRLLRKIRDSGFDNLNSVDYYWLIVFFAGKIGDSVSSDNTDSSDAYKHAEQLLNDAQIDADQVNITTEYLPYLRDYAKRMISIYKITK